MARIPSKLDVIQIARRAFIEEKDAIAVELSGMEVGIELSHQDGDSIHSISKMNTIVASAGDIIDTSEAKTINILQRPEGLEIICLIERFVIPVTIAEGPQAICLPNIKINKDCIIILQS